MPTAHVNGRTAMSGIPATDHRAVTADGITVTLTRYLGTAKHNVPVAEARLSPRILEEVDRVNAELGDRGRVLVRPSGTEPLIRVLAEAERAEEAAELCASIAALVERELG